MTDEKDTVSPNEALAPQPSEPQVVLGAKLNHAPPARQKTHGEKIFNLETYGGFALLGNEAASLVIGHQAQHGYGKKWYDKGEQFFKKDLGVSKWKFIPEKWVPGYVREGHFQNVMIAVIGGMLMVPFVKAMEDNKGSIVRKLDRKHYGELSDTDPKLVEAHKEMDDAPKQSWSSLWKGRALTVVSAIGIDSLAGHSNSPSTTKILPNNQTWRRWSNMEAIGDRVAEFFTGSKQVTAWTKLSEVEQMLLKPAEQSLIKKAYWIQKGTWLLTLSSTLTLLFYASSKVFAKRQEEKTEEKLEQRTMRANGTYPDGDEIAADAAQTPASETSTDKPTSYVRSVSREDTVTTAPQLAHGA